MNNNPPNPPCNTDLTDVERVARALCKACGRDPDAILNEVPEWVYRQIEAKAALLVSNRSGEGRQDFSRLTLRHNIETILRQWRDAHPNTLLDKIMSAIPRTSLSHEDVERIARSALFKIELARVHHIQPVGGVFDYFQVEFAGHRTDFKLPYHDEDCDYIRGPSGPDLAELSGKAAAWATAINDLLFSLAKDAACTALDTENSEDHMSRGG